MFWFETAETSYSLELANEWKTYKQFYLLFIECGPESEIGILL
jgi:hypothetical protein